MAIADARAAIANAPPAFRELAAKLLAETCACRMAASGEWPASARAARPAAISNELIRFLRGECGLNYKSFGKILGCDERTARRWMKRIRPDDLARPVMGPYTAPVLALLLMPHDQLTPPEQHAARCLVQSLPDVSPMRIMPTVRGLERLVGLEPPQEIAAGVRDVLLRRWVKLKSDGLSLYRPIHEEAEAFHSSTAKWRLALGGNRSSKTMVCAVEAVRAWTGRDPHCKHRPRNGFCIVVGQDADHIAQLWAKIARPGAFQIIRDEKTGLWRAVRPDPNNPSELDPYDLSYREKWRDAPPLLPDDMIAHIGMEDAGKGVPRILTVKHTGWRVMFRTAGSRAARGEHYDLAVLDEHLESEDIFYEVVRGLVDVSTGYKSQGIWSATPQKQNFMLWELSRKASEGACEVDQFFFSIERNPYIPRSERDLFLQMLPEERALSQYYGEHAVVGWRIYPEFRKDETYLYEPFDIPDDWTLYLAVDPGVTRCATVFCAVPPNRAHIYIHDVMVLRGAGAQQWASALAARPDARKMRAWVIDERAGRQTGIAGGKSVAAQYYQAAKLLGVTPESYGPRDGFMPGCSDVKARIAALRSGLRVRESGAFAGTPLVQFAKGRTDVLLEQLERAQLDSRTRSRRMRGVYDALDALEYIVHYDPQPAGARVLRDDEVPQGSEGGVEGAVRALIRKKRARGRAVLVAPGMEIAR